MCFTRASGEQTLHPGSSHHTVAEPSCQSDVPSPAAPAQFPSMSNVQVGHPHPTGAATPSPEQPSPCHRLSLGGDPHPGAGAADGGACGDECSRGWAGTPAPPAPLTPLAPRHPRHPSMPGTPGTPGCERRDLLHQER